MARTGVTARQHHMIEVALSKWIIGAAGKEFVKRGLDHFTQTALPGELAKGLRSWAHALPDAYSGAEPEYLVDILFENIPGDILGPSQRALAEGIAEFQIPSPEIWYRALEERRVEAGELLRGKLALSAKNALFLAEEGEVADYLMDAARRLELVCQKNKDFFQPSIHKKLDRLDTKFDKIDKFAEIFFEFNRKHPAVEAKNSEPWRLQHFIKTPTRESCPAEPLLKLDQWVVATFGVDPTSKWKDPFARIRGSWDERNEEISPFADLPCQVVLPDGRKLACDCTALCVPSYKVDVEWREETLVTGPLWGAIKRQAVSRFLKHCQGHKMLCRIAYVGERQARGIFHLCSADYDAYLQEEWSYFKGLENALAKNVLYKVRMSETERRELAKNLTQEGRVDANLAERYHREIGNRPIAEEDVDLVLRGLIERYRLLLPRPVIYKQSARRQNSRKAAAHLPKRDRFRRSQR